MKKKQFKTESKKLLDMMINSIYTHKEIFLRELISNASDALDKLYFRSLTDSSVILSREDYAIYLSADKTARTLTITDNGIGMTKDELEINLGTIAKSGSFEFKRDNDAGEDVDIIGQFGVGFYSAFMVAKRIVVTSRPYGSGEAWLWESEGADGYTLEACEKESFGTEITLYLKDDGEDESYSEYLEEYTIRELIKKYSDYIRYPIKMQVTTEEKVEGEDRYESVTAVKTLNSMVPLWKRPTSEVTADEYNSFYREKFYDYEPPVRVITQKSEGLSEFTALLFIPRHAPYNYYTREYEKGLELYSSGVMIMEKCADLVPDYFSFVKGLVDSQDLSLNISREMLQHDRQLRVIAKAIEKKIKSELEKLMEEDRVGYEKFFEAFGIQLKYGIYSDYGMHKDMLKDLLIFRSSSGDKKYISLKEYVAAMTDEQKAIYYAAGESVEKIERLPQVSAVKSRGYEVLYLTDDIDEFALRVLESYEGKSFTNVTAEALDIATDEEREREKNVNEAEDELLGFMKSEIGKVKAVKFSSSLGNSPVCLSTEGELSVEMAKTLKKMPGAEGDVPEADIVLEINLGHPIADKLRSLFGEDKEKVSAYAKILYSLACLISGEDAFDPVELTGLLTGLMI